MRRALTAFLGLVAVAAAASGAAAQASGVQLTPVGRLPFPERGYIIDLSSGVIDPSAIRVHENGRRVRHLQVSPLGESGIHFGVILAVDASESMTGAPLAAAVDAARGFVAEREGEREEIGVIAFNGSVRVLQRPTADSVDLDTALSKPPTVAYGTRIYDALDRALILLDRARLSTGSIVLLSDGADIGSLAGLEAVVAKARARHVRIFTVGLRSRAFEEAPLRALAEGSGGSYVDAPTPARLRSIYATLGRRLAGEYLVRYRSDALPRSDVRVTIEVEGVGEATNEYKAPTPAGVKPFRRSAFSRFLVSPGAPVLLSLLVAALVALTLVAFIRPRKSTVVERVTVFAGRQAQPRPRQQERWAPKHRPTSGATAPGWYAKLERDIEVARIDASASKIALVTLATTVAAMFVLALLSPFFAVLGLLTPLGTKSVISRRLKKVRGEFDDQLAPNLQVLASALRVGHSFVGALTVVVENAHEPSRSELQRVITDEQLGVPVEEAVRRVAARMASRDLEQVALLAELQRTAGGNSAEVLDTVVDTLRERADLRRLIKTLTAQGRMARWILTALPVFAGLAMWGLQGDLMRPLFTTDGGQIAIVVAALMVTAGSLVIQKIVDIKV
jgi:tight adherence protein B